MTVDTTRRNMLKAGLAAAAASMVGAEAHAQAGQAPLLILRNGKFTTLDPARAEAGAVAIADGRFTALGSEQDIMKLPGPKQQDVDLGGRAVAQPELRAADPEPVRRSVRDRHLERRAGTARLRLLRVQRRTLARRLPQQRAERRPRSLLVPVVRVLDRRQFPVAVLGRLGRRSGRQPRRHDHPRRVHAGHVSAGAGHAGVVRSRSAGSRVRAPQEGVTRSLAGLVTRETRLFGGFLLFSAA